MCIGARLSLIKITKKLCYNYLCGSCYGRFEYNTMFAGPLARTKFCNSMPFRITWSHEFTTVIVVILRHPLQRSRSMLRTRSRVKNAPSVLFHRTAGPLNSFWIIH